MDIMLFFLGLLSQALSQTCYTFVCSNSTGDETCSSFQNPVVTQSQCYFGLFCEQEDFEGNCEAYPEDMALPGEFCSSNDDCYSGRCYSNDTCTGKLKGVSCSSSYECAEGYFCSKGKCAAQLSIGSPCEDYSECVNTAVCENNTCTEMFSVEVGSETWTVLEPNFYPACETGYATTTDNSFICAVAPVSKSKGANCTVPSKCMAADNVNYKFCECGLDGNGHCPLFEGDTEVVAMIDAWKHLMNISGSNVCNTMHRYSYACYVGFGDQTLLNAYLEYSKYVELYFAGVYSLLPGSTPCQRAANVPHYVNIMNQLQGTAPVCPVYTRVIKEIEEECVVYKEGIFNSLHATSVLIYDCNQTSTCSSSLGTNGICVENTQTLQLPGQNCTLALNCLSDKCVNHKCEGATVDQLCKTNADCNPNLYCMNNGKNLTCQPVKTAGESCSNTDPCASNLLCDENLCIAYFSKQVGANTTIYSDGYSETCSTGFAIPNEHGTYTCELAPTSTTAGAKCNPGTMCTDTSGKYKKPCTCGFDGNGYCSAFEGDSYLQTAIKQYKVISEITCNLENRLSPGCFEADLKDSLYYYYFMTNFTKYQNLPYFQGNYDSGVWLNYFLSYNNAEVQIKKILNELNPHHDDSSSSSSSSSSFGSLIKVTGLILAFLVN